MVALRFLCQSISINLTLVTGCRVCAKDGITNWPFPPADSFSGAMRAAMPITDNLPSQGRIDSAYVDHSNRADHDGPPGHGGRDHTCVEDKMEGTLQCKGGGMPFLLVVVLLPTAPIHVLFSSFLCSVQGIRRGELLRVPMMFVTCPTFVTFDVYSQPKSCFSVHNVYIHTHAFPCVTSFAMQILCNCSTCVRTYAFSNDAGHGPPAEAVGWLPPAGLVLTADIAAKTNAGDGSVSIAEQVARAGVAAALAVHVPICSRGNGPYNVFTEGEDSRRSSRGSFAEGASSDMSTSVSGGASDAAGSGELAVVATPDGSDAHLDSYTGMDCPAHVSHALQSLRNVKGAFNRPCVDIYLSG